MRDDARLPGHADAVAVAVGRMLAVADVVVVEQVDLAEAHARRAAGDVFEQVVVEGDAQAAGVVHRLVTGADQRVLRVQREMVVRDRHVVAGFADVEGTVMALPGFAILDRERVVRERRVGKAVVVDPDMLRADDRDGVEFRVPVALVPVLRIPGRLDVAGIAQLEIADDDLRDLRYQQVGVDKARAGAEADQRGIGRQAYQAAFGLVGMAAEGRPSLMSMTPSTWTIRLPWMVLPSALRNCAALLTVRMLAAGASAPPRVPPACAAQPSAGAASRMGAEAASAGPASTAETIRAKGSFFMRIACVG